MSSGYFPPVIDRSGQHAIVLVERLTISWWRSCADATANSVCIRYGFCKPPCQYSNRRYLYIRRFNFRPFRVRPTYIERKLRNMISPYSRHFFTKWGNGSRTKTFQPREALPIQTELVSSIRADNNRLQVGLDDTWWVLAFVLASMHGCIRAESFRTSTMQPYV
jgi:hypothetical protein